LAQIFPRWTNKLPRWMALGAVLSLVLVVGLFRYFGSPEFTDVGYQPVQPVSYSHKIHAGDLKLDCRYCHTGVEISPVAMAPPTRTCMNCHVLIKPESEALAPVRASWESGESIKWVRVHKLPDYAYFDHRAHLSVGVGCAGCHGNVAVMEVVRQAEPLSMGWCLRCHRNPELHLRPLDQVTNMAWQPPADQREFAARVIQTKEINPPVSCSGCHR